MEALQNLKKNNPLYKDLEIYEQWLNDWQREDPQLTNALIERVTVEISESQSSNSDEVTEGLPSTLSIIADKGSQ